ncbi:Hpt domain-containing protein [Tenacibaculum haliotis]|uniref:Hpt domain-containing protein n=1 Tax=Tenacibaculum haliotis TaxID=1888914 RepID=UPI0021B00C29|nr:Hpt domain-containing protein [Tenacibaculum haliotis]MCT4699687.1 Hpt domain-containing protein [Tenacibaculum haliotis]
MFDKKRNPSSIVDTSFLNEQLDGDPEQIAMMISLFLKQSPKKIAELKEGVQKNDFIEIKAAAHFLKSSFAIMGISSKDLLSKVEKLSATNSELEKIKAFCTVIFKNYQESILEYKKILSFINTK